MQEKHISHPRQLCAIVSNLSKETDPDRRRDLENEYESSFHERSLQLPEHQVADCEYMRELRKKDWNSGIPLEEILHDHFP